MAIARNILRQVMLDNQKDVERYNIFPRNYDLDSFPLQIFVGVRRSGKSFLLFQKILISRRNHKGTRSERSWQITQCISMQTPSYYHV